ncbi:uncharacterized protein BDZ99DRAFT_548487 [Mytilinidion resinicola]|uniref:F-box domain-containing protein n=1 Tax=Mytilinidion resinicola TaxID=574789 RepID=A0A6A6Z0I2_9PEZI|nr:uncharacterized protein BDZ99DRAFT_548487 [Mytilinidion resinicola]KAF2814530.1 hypothetical protein BDZ99DRAFT_548487 [Mytilinidion resinicola]
MAQPSDQTVNETQTLFVTGLPVELLDQVRSNMSFEDACSAQLAQKAFCPSASRRLVHTLRVTPTDASVEKLSVTASSEWAESCCFTNLESLSLANYGIWSEVQVEWIFQHQKTSESLSLIVCPIIYLFVCKTTREELAYPQWGNEDPQLNSHEEEVLDLLYKPLYEKVAPGVFLTKFTWAQCFKLINDKLPNLTHFRFDSRGGTLFHLGLDDSELVKRENRYGWVEERYHYYNFRGDARRVMNHDIAGMPGRTLHPYSDMDQGASGVDKQHQEDAAALRDLLKKTGQFKSEESKEQFRKDFEEFDWSPKRDYGPGYRMINWRPPPIESA